MKLKVNGYLHLVESDPSTRLVDVLRDELGLDGVKEGCGIGICGTCTVLVDGRPMSSCLLMSGQAEDHDIITIEGLETGAGLHPVQQSFIDHAAFQCAYCTPGFVLTTVALLDQNPDPSDAEIREYLSGNLCRCGSYLNILRAVKASAASDGPSGRPSL
jgi:aerobic-type carbon monoxide dehydrogenase small subunit (CoxS/CutS family)